MRAWKVLVAVALVAIGLAVPTSKASATPSACSNDHQHVGGDWQPTADFAYGIRGPVQARRDGSPCYSSDPDGGFGGLASG
jgi:hypothetical protein